MAQLSHGYLAYSVASDEKLLETSRGLGTGGPAESRHRGQQRARGEKSKEDDGHMSGQMKSLKNLILDKFSVVD